MLGLFGRFDFGFGRVEDRGRSSSSSELSAAGIDCIDVSACPLSEPSKAVGFEVRDAGFFRDRTLVSSADRGTSSSSSFPSSLPDSDSRIVKWSY
jgi:hypothetical protein